MSIQHEFSQWGQIAYWANAQQSASEADIQEAAALVRRAWRLVKETL